LISNLLDKITTTLAAPSIYGPSPEFPIFSGYGNYSHERKNATVGTGKGRVSPAGWVCEMQKQPYLMWDGRAGTCNCDLKKALSPDAGW